MEDNCQAINYEDNPQLQLAKDFIQFTGANVFLTGKAGTGKTTFLHHLKDYSPKRMIVTAPTGVAAINAGGVTLHSFFQLPFGPQVLQKTAGGEMSDRQKDINKFSREKVNIIRSLDLLVIDEISMVRSDLLDAVDRVLRRYKNKYKPFGGVQLLMIGDLQQLAPVVKEEDWEILKSYYDSPFFFSSLALRKTEFVCVELQHIFRQTDKRFINLLNKVRENTLDKEAIDLLNSRYKPDFSPDDEQGYITLTTHNQQANRINFLHMNQLDAPASIFSAEISGTFPEYSYPNEPELVIKPGAQVMFVKNDASREKRYYNGKIGTITSIEDDIVYVSCPGEDEEIATEAIEWHNYSYSIDENTEEIVEKLLGTYKQMPLKPAWAITIHKSQGLTFEKAIIDANAAFAHGQVYVALSRCRTLEGMVLKSRIESNSLKADGSVTGFMRSIENNPPDEKTLNALRHEFERSLLIELNDFSPIIRRLEYCIKLIRENETILQGHPMTICQKVYESCQKELMDVSRKFARQLQQLLAINPDVEHNLMLQERLRKSSLYYSEKLSNLYDTFFEEFVLETDNKALKNSIKEAVGKMNDEFNYKQVCLEAIKSNFSVSTYLSARAKAGIEKMPVRKTAGGGPKTFKKSFEDIGSEHVGIRPVKDVAITDIQYPELYNSLRQWRNQKAAEKKCPVYLVLPGKSLVELVNNLPKNLSQLASINGIGEKKLQLYGRDILKIILDYCSK